MLTLREYKKEEKDQVEMATYCFSWYFYLEVRRMFHLCSELTGIEIQIPYTTNVTYCLDYRLHPILN